ncbi:hypothetical protein ABLG96_21430 [Nakamurella sp. A5-74]|uniref:SdpI family protein n=1 Tax=Nakamurella sp. A5-74 TaxID=3158264 RepID=A0AAU8DPL0_9ACTN
MPASLLLSIPLAVILLVPGVAALLTGHRGWRGTLDPASALGVRGPAAEVSPQSAAVANRIAAPVIAAAGAVLSIGGLLTVALRLPTAATIVVFVVALVGGVALLVVAGSVGERAAMTVPRPATKPVGCSGCACGAGGCGSGAADGSTTVESTPVGSTPAGSTPAGSTTVEPHSREHAG